MQYNTKYPLTILMAYLLLGGCLSVDYSEKIPAISTDQQFIQVRADIPADKESITDTLKISSNQSWGLNILDGAGEPVDWIEADICEHLNLSGITEETTVVLTFEFNIMTSERSAQLTITSSDCEKNISLTQNAADRFLMVEEKQVSIPYAQTDYTVNVIANTKWKAIMNDGASADMEFYGAEGEGDGAFIVSFAENNDPFQEKSASVTVSAEGCPDIEITFTQRRCGKLILDVDFASQPFDEDLKTTTTGIESEIFTFRQYGEAFSFVFGKNDKLQYLQANSCIVLSRGAISLPAVAGMSLREVSITCVATDKKFLITSAPASSPVVSGGANKTLAKDETGTWTLSDTVENTVYYIYSNSSNSRISHIRLVYE